MARNYHVAKAGEVHLNAFPDGSGATVYLCKIAGGDLASTVQPAAPTDDPTADTSQSADEAIYAADQAAAATSQADADAAAEIDRTNSASGADVPQDQGDD